MDKNQVYSQQKSGCFNDSFDAWYTLCIVFILYVLLGLNFMIFPVFYVHFSEEFSTSKALTGAVGSIQQGTCNLLGEFVMTSCAYTQHTYSGNHTGPKLYS